MSLNLFCNLQSTAGLTLPFIESALSRTQNLACDERGEATRNMNDAGTGEINHTNSEERVGSERRQETIDTPDGMDYDRIDKGRQKGGIKEVCNHLTPLGQRTGHNRCRRSREGELIQPEAVVLYSDQEKVAIPNECGCRLHGFTGVDDRISPPIVASVAVSEGVPDTEKGQSGATTVQQVLHDGVLNVLLLDAAGTQHGKATLHKEHDTGREDEEEDVDPGGQTLEIGGHGLHIIRDALQGDLCIATAGGYAAFDTAGIRGHGVRRFKYAVALFQSSALQLIQQIAK
mmetsp:Transcript_303/g.841  ORF Transcript_303/g.841 Transcript_303/m.841 type:complete len:288 (+) Transcript_303:2222-3085(+)